MRQDFVALRGKKIAARFRRRAAVPMGAAAIDHPGATTPA
jgi:hypothetical protein